MKTDKIYDYIIAGAGAAGLSLLAHLIESSLSAKTILVIDSSLKPKSDKTWCFWNQSHNFMHLVHHTWKKLEVISQNKSFEESLQYYAYHCIRSETYQEQILSAAHNSDNVTLLESKILDFTEQDNIGIIITGDGTFGAEWVFQSVFKHPDYHNSIADTSLVQHFTGWEIESSKPVFDPGKATFMDFNTDQLSGLTFFYVLPFTKQRALIEHTIFTDRKPEQEEEAKEEILTIKNYILDRYELKDSDYKIVRKETGDIPMEDRRIPAWYNNKTLNIGTVGGVTKSTTGYTFTRAHEHSREIVRALEKNKKPVPYSGSSYRFRVYDIMLLYLLKNEKDVGKQIFHELFKNNKMELLLRFMDEKTTLTEELGIFSTLPPSPFFRSIYKMKHRIFRGA